MLLLTPGPTEIPEESMRALMRKAHHRTGEFRETLLGVSEKLKYVYRTGNDVLVFTSSGTGGMEASIANVFSPGDRVLVCSCGKFGDRFLEIARAYGLDVKAYQEEWGRAINPGKVSEMLDNDTRAVLMTHNETSTGVVNDVEAIGKVVKENGSLFIVDCISSLGVMDFEADEWGVDLAVSGSQKGFMTPPGLAFVSVSQEAWNFCRESRLPKYYFSFESHRKKLESGDTPFTPAIPQVFALNTSLDYMKSQGLENIFRKYQELADITREGVKGLGLGLLAERPSNTLTAVLSEKSQEIVKSMKEKGILIANGQEHLKGKIFRIAHVGHIQREHIEQCLEALKDVLENMRGSMI